MAERPSCIPKASLRGSQAKGIRYEKHFARALRTEFGDANVYADQWISFVDEYGQSFACIDSFVVGERCVLLCEVKLTWTPEMAWWQMERRYAPILRHIYGKPVATLQVCKNLARGYPISTAERRTPRYLFENPEPGRFTYHWLGR